MFLSLGTPSASSSAPHATHGCVSRNLCWSLEDHRSAAADHCRPTVSSTTKCKLIGIHVLWIGRPLDCYGRPCAVLWKRRVQMQQIQIGDPSREMGPSRMLSLNILQRLRLRIRHGVAKEDFVYEVLRTACVVCCVCVCVCVCVCGLRTIGCAYSVFGKVKAVVLCASFAQALRRSPPPTVTIVREKIGEITLPTDRLERRCGAFALFPQGPWCLLRDTKTRDMDMVC